MQHLLLCEVYYRRDARLGYLENNTHTHTNRGLTRQLLSLSKYKIISNLIKKKLKTVRVVLQLGISSTFYVRH